MKSIPAIDGGNPVREDFLVFGKPQICQEEIDEVVDTMQSGWLSTGPKTARFEDSFAQYKNAEHAVGLSSCTAALFLGLRALKLQPGDEVISTDFTFTASISAIIHNGLKPVLCDVEMKTQNIDCTQIESKITPRTRAILPVHMCGLPCNMDAIMDIANRYNLFVVEDCAHAIEATYNGKHLGTFGDVGAFSFYATKNIACGEGGMLTTSNEDIARDIRLSSLHGLSKNAHNRYGSSGFSHYQVLDAGYKYNMMDLVASIGIHQLARIEDSWQRRKEIAERYCSGLHGLPVYLPPQPKPGIKSAYHLFTIQLKLDQLRVNRDFILDALKAEGIGAGVHYNAIHTHPYYARVLGAVADDFPNAQWLSDRTISLPLSAALEDHDVDDVVEACRKILIYYQR